MSESEHICGGLSEVETKDFPDIESKVSESFDALGAQDNKPTFKLGKIISAKKQVVAGIVYHITAEVLDGGKPKLCKLRIWERPWTGERHVDIECDNKSFKVIRDVPKHVT